MKSKLRAIVFLCFVMLLLAVIYCSLTSCTRTVKNAVVTHDTIEVVKSSIDSLNVRQNSRDEERKSKVDTVYQVKTDTVVKTIEKRDSIVVRDSIYVRQKNDTTYIYKEKWRTKLVASHDTVYKVKVDTVYKTHTDTVYQTKTDTVRILRFINASDSIKAVSTSEHEVVKEKSTWRWWHTLACIFWILITVFGGLWIYRKVNDS